MSDDKTRQISEKSQGKFEEVKGKSTKKERKKRNCKSGIILPLFLFPLPLFLLFLSPFVIFLPRLSQIRKTRLERRALSVRRRMYYHFVKELILMKMATLRNQRSEISTLSTVKLKAQVKLIPIDMPIIASMRNRCAPFRLLESTQCYFVPPLSKGRISFST